MCIFSLPMNQIKRFLFHRHANMFNGILNGNIIFSSLRVSAVHPSICTHCIHGRQKKWSGANCMNNVRVEEVHLRMFRLYQGGRKPDTLFQIISSSVLVCRMQKRDACEKSNFTHLSMSKLNANLILVGARRACVAKPKTVEDKKRHIPNGVSAASLAVARLS